MRRSVPFLALLLILVFTAGDDEGQGVIFKPATGPVLGGSLPTNTIPKSGSSGTSLVASSMTDDGSFVFTSDSIYLVQDSFLGWTATLGGSEVASQIYKSSPAELVTRVGASTIWRNIIVTNATTLTNSAATTIVIVSGLGAHKRVGGTIELCVEAADATNDQIACGTGYWGAVDTTAGAGGEACGFFFPNTVSAAASGAASSGTLTVTAAATTGTDSCNLRITPTSSLTPTTLRATFTIRQQAQILATIVPQ